MNRRPGAGAAVLLMVSTVAFGPLGVSQETPPWGDMEQLRPEIVIGEWSGGAETDLPFLASPTALAFDEAGLLYVVDTGNQRVAVFDREGTFVREFGREGDGPGEFRFRPRMIGTADIVVGQHAAYVLDRLQRRIHEFSLEGEILATRTLPVMPDGLALDGNFLYMGLYGPESRSQGAFLRLHLRSGETTGLGDPMVETDDSYVDRLSLRRVAAGAGRLLEAYVRWPAIRFTDSVSGISSDPVYLGPEWWISPHYRKAAEEVEAAFHAARSGQPFTAPVTFFFHDAEHDASADRWLLLSTASMVQVVTVDGRRARSVHLAPPKPHGSEDWYRMEAIAVDRTGERLCGAAQSDSAVACYRLPPD